MHHQPDGAAFDIVLLLHVGCVVVGLVTTAAAAATASRLRRLLGSPAAAARAAACATSGPASTGPGRTVYGIPVFGFALLAMSQGAYALGQGWVLGGLALFAGVALLGEGVLWPAERRLQSALAAGRATWARSRTRAPADLSDSDVARCHVLARAGAALRPAVAGVVLMVAQP